MENNKNAIHENLKVEKLRVYLNKTNGFTMIDNCTSQDILSQCGANAFAIYFTLLKHWNHKTGVCDASIPTLAKECNLSESTVKRNIKSLKEKGFIGIVHKKSRNNNFSINYYYFMYPKNMITDEEINAIEEDNDSDKTASEEVKEEVKEEVEEVPEEVEEAKEEDKIYNNVKKMVGELNKFQKNINDSYKKVTLNGYIININKFFKMNNENSIKWTLEEINNYLCAVDKRNKRSPIPGMPGKRVTPIIAGINDFNEFKEVLNINKDL